ERVTCRRQRRRDAERIDARLEKVRGANLLRRHTEGPGRHACGRPEVHRATELLAVVERTPSRIGPAEPNRIRSPGRGPRPRGYFDRVPPSVPPDRHPGRVAKPTGAPSVERAGGVRDRLRPVRSDVDGVRTLRRAGRGCSPPGGREADRCTSRSDDDCRSHVHLTLTRVTPKPRIRRLTGVTSSPTPVFSTGKPSGTT